MTDNTENVTSANILAPELPKPDPNNLMTEQPKPTSYGAVSGQSQSVAQLRYNPITATEQPQNSTTNTDKIEKKSEINPIPTTNVITTTPAKSSDHQMQSKKEASPKAQNITSINPSTPTQPQPTSIQPQPSSTISTPPQTANTQNNNAINQQVQQVQMPQSQQVQAQQAQAQQQAAQQQAQLQQIQQMQQQQMQQQLAQQQMAMNPMMQMINNQQTQQNQMGLDKKINKYTCWPPQEQQLYSSFHPLGWPIDPDYQYQISNYLGPSSMAAAQAAAQNQLMAQNMNPATLQLLAASNPLLAASMSQNMGMIPGMAQNMNMFNTNPLLAATANIANTNNPQNNPGNNAANTNNQLLAAAALGGLGGAALGGLSGIGGAALGGLGALGGLAANSSLNASGKQFSLFVFHLPEDIDDHGLLQLFAPYGAMRSNVMRHDTGRSRGFGFVHFNTRHEAQIAIDMMNGHQIGRKRLRVSFKREELNGQHDKMRGNGLQNNAQSPPQQSGMNGIGMKDQ